MRKLLLVFFILLVSFTPLEAKAATATDDTLLIDEFEMYSERIQHYIFRMVENEYQDLGDQAFNNTKLVAAIYGYSLIKVWDKAEKRDSEYRRLFNVLKHYCLKRITDHSYQVKRTKGWDEMDRLGHEGLAMKEFHSMLDGTSRDIAIMDKYGIFPLDIIGNHVGRNQPQQINLEGIYNGNNMRVELRERTFFGIKRRYIPRRGYAESDLFKLYSKPDVNHGGSLSRWSGSILDSNHIWRNCTATFNRSTGVLEITDIYGKKTTYWRSKK